MNNKLLKKINKMRTSLNNLIERNADKDKIYYLSCQLDKLILDYYKH